MIYAGKTYVKMTAVLCCHFGLKHVQIPAYFFTKKGILAVATLLLPSDT